jgi:hypothetical protein
MRPWAAYCVSSSLKRTSRSLTKGISPVGAKVRMSCALARAVARRWDISGGKYSRDSLMRARRVSTLCSSCSRSVSLLWLVWKVSSAAASWESWR